MFDIKSCLSQLENVQKPANLQECSIFLTEAVPLRIASVVDTPFSASKVLFKNSKSTKKPNPKNIWDADMTSSSPGYFDSTGNFIVDKPKKITTSWILKRNGACEGPFSEKEFKEFLNNAAPKGYFIKRDFDKGFVSLEKLMEDIPNFISSRELSRYFSQNQQVDEVKKENSFFDEPIFIEKGSRLTNFLRNHEISASIDFIIKTIKGMRKVEAIEGLNGITGLDKNINTSLVDLIVESVGYQILSDVDKDGFYLGDEPKKEKKRINK